MRNKRKLCSLSGNAVRTAKTIYFCISAVFCVIGIFLIIKNPAVLRHTWTLCGVCLILHGCMEINGHYIKDLYMLAFTNGLYVGGLSILMGILLLHPAPDFCERLCQFPVCITGNGPIGRCIGKNRTGASCKIFWHCILVDHPGKRDPYRRHQYLSDGISGRIQLYSRPENRTASSVCRFFECVDSIDCSPCPYKASPSGGSSSGRVSLGAVRNFSAILSGRNQGSMECDRSTRNG